MGTQSDTTTQGELTTPEKIDHWSNIIIDHVDRSLGQSMVDAVLEACPDDAPYATVIGTLLATATSIILSSDENVELGELQAVIFPATLQKMIVAAKYAGAVNATKQ